MIAEMLRDLDREESKSRSMLHMTSYENRMSKTASRYLDADLGNRYLLSTPYDYDGNDSSIYLPGFSCRALKGVHQLQVEAVKAANRMFGAAHAELRLISGVHGTLSTIATMTNPGDAVYSISPEDGGHFATKQIAESLGRVSKYLVWDNHNLQIDLEGSCREFAQTKPAMVFLDHGTPLFNLPVTDLKERLPDDCILVYDGSHTLGLIAGGYFQKPLAEGADILQGNTHKTFPGPQKALVLFRDKSLGERYSQAISEGLVSSQHTHHSLALGVTVLEMQEFGEQYGRDMLANAQALGNGLLAQGLELSNRDGCFTTSHELLISSGWCDDYLQAVDRLFQSKISVNVRIAFARPTIRLGVQEVTRRGMGVAEMGRIAGILSRALEHPDVQISVSQDVAELNREFPKIRYSFDELEHSTLEHT